MIIHGHNNSALAMDETHFHDNNYNLIKSRYYIKPRWCVCFN